MFAEDGETYEAIPYEWSFQSGQFVIDFNHVGLVVLIPLSFLALAIVERINNKAISK